MVVFVGDTPSKRMKPGAKPFEGAACERRLMSWIETILDLNPVHNLLDMGDYMITNRDTMLFKFLRLTTSNRWCFIALGNNASRTLGKKEHFKLPHPSGRNRQINNKAFIDQKLLECKKYIEAHYDKSR